MKFQDEVVPSASHRRPDRLASNLQQRVTGHTSTSVTFCWIYKCDVMHPAYSKTSCTNTDSTIKSRANTKVFVCKWSKWFSIFNSIHPRCAFVSRAADPDVRRAGRVSPPDTRTLAADCTLADTAVWTAVLRLKDTPSLWPQGQWAARSAVKTTACGYLPCQWTHLQGASWCSARSRATHVVGGSFCVVFMAHEELTDGFMSLSSAEKQP